MKTYTFFIETEDGERTEWRGLTLKQARDMNAFTHKRIPVNVKCFGWEPTDNPA